MFEKEADYITDYKKARKESKDKITKVISVWSAREETLHEEGFKDGAEFGYNKAMNEVGYRMETAHREGVAFGKDKAKEDFAKQLKEVVETCNHWQEVAEKANEWHYVKDGDLPKTKGKYLVTWKRVHQEYGEWGFDVVLFDVEEECFEGIKDPIAWKEIVLPKEII